MQKQDSLGVVGHVDRLLLGLELDERHERAEGLLRERQHVPRHVGQHGRFEEGASLGVERGVGLAAHQQRRAFLHAVLDVRGDLQSGVVFGEVISLL